MAAGAQGEPAHLLLRQVEVPQTDADLPEEDVLPKTFLAQHAQPQLPLLQVPPGDPVVDQLEEGGGTQSRAEPQPPVPESPPKTLSPSPVPSRCRWGCRFFGPLWFSSWWFFGGRAAGRS